MAKLRAKARKSPTVKVYGKGIPASCFKSITVAQHRLVVGKHAKMDNTNMYMTNYSVPAILNPPATSITYL